MVLLLRIIPGYRRFPLLSSLAKLSHLQILYWTVLFADDTIGLVVALTPNLDEDAL